MGGGVDEAKKKHPPLQKCSSTIDHGIASYIQFDTWWSLVSPSRYFGALVMESMRGCKLL
jgi:hypothetical protein